jgi:hypothetical protein
MSLHVLTLQKKLPLRVFGIAALFLGAVGLEYHLSNYPQPVDVSDSKYAAKVKVQQELVLRNPQVAELLTHQADPNEVVNVSCEAAQLNRQTLEALKTPKFAPPEELTHIDCLTPYVVWKEGDRAPRVGIHIRFGPSNGKIPELHLFQMDRDQPDPNTYRSLALHSVGADLYVTLDILYDPTDEGGFPRHYKSLSFPDRNAETPIYAPTKITLVVPPEKTIHFQFRPVSDKVTVWKKDSPYLPFIPGVPPENPHGGPPCRIHLALIKSAQERDEASDDLPMRLQDAKEKAWPLSLERLDVQADQLEADFTGRAMAEQDGKPVTVDLLTRAKNNPLLGSLSATVDAALLAWFISCFKKPAPVPAAPEPEPARPRRRHRRDD